MQNELFGTEGHDEVTGTSAADVVTTYAGHDFIYTLEGNDEIYAGDGHDVIEAGAGNDKIYGGAGYDIMDGGEGSDIYYVGLDNLGFVDTYNDTGLSGTDRVSAVEANTVIGLITGFGPDSGIEIISSNKMENVTIGGTNDAEIWDFSAVRLSGIVAINGLGGNDDIVGNKQRNVIDGGEGQDILSGAAGNDQLFGNVGHDVLNGDEGRDMLDGGDGHDILNGGLGNDKLIGGEGHDTLNGGEGNDTLTGGAGYDILDGGEGSDRYFVGLENAGFVDTYTDTGTEGVDKILATEDNVVIGLIDGFGPGSGIEVIGSRGHENVTIGGTDDAEVWDLTGVRLNGIQAINMMGGHDSFNGSDRRDKVDGGDGHDVLVGNAGNDWLWGSAGNDRLEGGSGRDRLDGGEGFDTLDGGEDGDLYLFNTASNGWLDSILDSGETGTDRIIATEADTVIGLADGFDQLSSGIEVISGRRNDNVTIGGDDSRQEWDFSNIKIWGVDAINAGGGNDLVTGSNRGDTINGEAGQDVLFGGNGRDSLSGGDGHDILYGEAGRDTLDGGDGNDILYGGDGNDVMTGGAGYDTFVVNDQAGRDTITDFTVGEDVLQFIDFVPELMQDELELTDTNAGLRIEVAGTRITLEGLTSEDFTWDMILIG